MKYAIVVSGGKQYKAVPGEVLQVDKLPIETGKKFVLKEVLFISDGYHWYSADQGSQGRNDCHRPN